MTISKELESLVSLDERFAKVLEEDISKDYRIHVEGIRQGISLSIRAIKKISEEG
jgi:hypothetical protein